MCVCMYVYVYVCVYVCLCVYVCMYACMYVFKYACMYVCISAIQLSSGTFKRILKLNYYVPKKSAKFLDI